MNEGQNAVAFFPAVFASEPSIVKQLARVAAGDSRVDALPWGLGQQKEPEEKSDGRNHLQAPRDTESRRSVNIAAPVGDVEHDENAPCNSPLLSTDHTTTFARRCQFGDVDRDYIMIRYESSLRNAGYLEQSRYRH